VAIILLWLPKITDRHNLDSGLRRLLETLDKSKVATAEKAEGAALGAKLKAGGLLAEEGARVVGLVRLGVDVAEFATSGDLVWVSPDRTRRARSDPGGLGQFDNRRGPGSVASAGATGPVVAH
jgi:hypothetical protein